MLSPRLDPDRFAALTPHPALCHLLATAVYTWPGRVKRTGGVVVGITSHTHASGSAHETASMWFETLPRAARLHSETTISSLHEEIRTNFMGLMMHASKGVCHAAGHVRAKVFLNSLKLDFGALDDRPATVAWLKNDHIEPSHAIWIGLLDIGADSELTLYLRFNEDMFPLKLHQRAASQIVQCIDDMLEERDMPATHVRGDPRTGAANPDGIYAAFTRIAQAEDDGMTLIDDEKVCTRAELNNHSGAIAEPVKRQGFGKNDRSGLVMTRVFDHVAAVLEILKSGAACVSRAPFQPKARLQGIAACVTLDTKFIDQLGAFFGEKRYG